MNEPYFEGLFKKYFVVLLAYASKFVDSESARDIVQDMFTHLWENNQQIHILQSEKAYLFKAVHNRCLDYILKKKKNQFTSDLDEISLKYNELLYFDPETAQEESLLQKNVGNLIQDAIGQLPESCKNSFVMSYIQHKKCREIAEERGISVRTVETQIFQALKILRQKLSNVVVLDILFCISAFMFFL